VKCHHCFDTGKIRVRRRDSPDGVAIQCPYCTEEIEPRAPLTKRTRVINQAGEILATYPDYLDQVKVGNEFHVGQQCFMVHAVNHDPEGLELVVVVRYTRNAGEER